MIDPAVAVADVVFGALENALRGDDVLGAVDRDGATRCYVTDPFGQIARIDVTAVARRHSPPTDLEVELLDGESVL